MKFSHRQGLIITFGAFLAFFSANYCFGMKIKVVTPVSKTVTVTVEPDDTIAEVKEFVYNVTELHVLNQKMFMDDTELEDSRTLESYGITDGTTLTIKHSRGSFQPADKGTSGLVKVIIAIVIIAIVVTIVKKTILANPSR